ECGVIEVMGKNLDVVDGERALDQVVITNGGRELLKRHRKIGVLHLPRERIAQGLREALGAVDVPLGAWREQRRKEREALDMVPVRVADQDVARLDAGLLQPLAERMRAGAAINDNQRSPSRAQLDAGR